MPAVNKGLTCKFLLRMTPAERSRAQAVVEDYADFDITISLNDAIRILIRRGSTPPPRTVGAATAAIKEHWLGCEHCDDQMIGCPEGRFVKVAYDRVPGAFPTVSPAMKRAWMRPAPDVV